ncbi:MAG: pyridoxal 5'-phosphate synthase glutaminase subunit PdxT [Firmicutes bacterium]|jgi:5'-phosphate synthase pdxT subunit|nr:pyridoxal 5'-phosphate synthase glutaminase subunit PdxT [Bacillota bacterium]MCL5064977.1 pyridoxal 5'-phosphate synthase glutaminase subunit PdxT [Bacillota bacterium]
MRIGILSIQGDVREHERMFQRLGLESARIRQPEDLVDLSGLVIPGGESTTIGMLMQEYGLIDAIKEKTRSGHFPIWGTCAGLILLAKEVLGPSPARLGLVDMTADRNAWGRQVSSFEADIAIAALGSPPYPGVFIRAPRIKRLGQEVTALASYQDQVVMAESGPYLVTAFHPELTDDLRVHQYFAQKVETYWRG